MSLDIDTSAVATSLNAAQAAMPLTLPAQLGIDHVGELHARLADVVDHIEPVRIDGSAVERVHTAAMQVLWLFAQARKRQHQAVEILNPSGSLQQAAALFGATALLQAAPSSLPSIE